MADQGDLFEGLPLLPWLPGETLFSLVSRHHHMWGHAVSSRTANLFFGHPQGGTHHDLPNRVGAFSSRTMDIYGSTRDIALERTLLRFFVPFLSELDIDNAVACMASPSVAHLKLRLGILTSRFRANHPLKACRACLEEDLSSGGWPCWHLQHQYPGVWICLKHGEALAESMLKSTGVARFQWHLPCHDSLQDTFKVSLPTQQALKDFAQLVQDFVDVFPNMGMAPADLHQVYRSELDRRSWLTPAGNVRLELAGESYLRHVSHLRVSEFSALPATSEDAQVQLGRLLRTPRGNAPPLRHLLIVSWLFRSYSNFEKACADRDACSQRIYSIGSKAVATPEDNAKIRERKIAALFSQPGMTFRRAAAALQVDVSTAMAWAAKTGIAAGRRPKKLKPELRAAVLEQLQNGGDRETVATQNGLSASTITRLLSTEMGLHDAWTAARNRQARQVSREAFTAAVEKHAASGTKFIRSLIPAEYAWLYRNDRAWLDSHKPDTRKPVASVGLGCVRWDARDRMLSLQIQQTVLALRQQPAAGKLKLWQIYQRVPELKAKLSVLDRLPLTRLSLTVALDRPPQDKRHDLFD